MERGLAQRRVRRLRLRHECSVLSLLLLLANSGPSLLEVLSNVANEVVFDYLFMGFILVQVDQLGEADVGLVFGDPVDLLC